MVNLNAIIKPAASPAANQPGTASGVIDAHATDSFGRLLAQQVADNAAHPAADMTAVDTQAATAPGKKAAMLTAGKTHGEHQTPAAADAAANLPGDMLALLQPAPAKAPAETKKDVPAANAAPTMHGATDKKSVTATPAADWYGNAAILPPQDIHNNIPGDAKTIESIDTTQNPASHQIPATSTPAIDIRNAVGSNIPGDAKTGKDKAVKSDTSGTTNRASDFRATQDTAPATPVKVQAAPASGGESAIRIIAAHTVQSVDTMPNVTPHQVAATPDLASLASRGMLHGTPYASTGSDAVQQSVNTPLGNAGWTDEFTQKISWMTTNQKEQIAELHLNPPDLGPLNVVLKVSDDQATATFTSPHSAVREAVENAMPKLREILADNGIALGNTTVSDQTPRDNGAQASLEQRTRNPDGGWAAHGLRQQDGNSAPVPPVSVARKHNGLVDTFV